MERCPAGVRVMSSLNKEDLETQVETHPFKRETGISTSTIMDGGVAELHADLGDLSQQLKMNAMCASMGWKG